MGAWKRVTVIVLGMASLLLAVAPAAGEPTNSADGYLLTVVPEEGAVISVTLRCAPDGGDHDNAPAACDQLRSVNGDVALLPARPGACTMEYAPVQVNAEGTWHGTPRHYAKTYPNRCEAILDTGGLLFAFSP